ncbi:MAG TPA: glycine oxidase ThiO [Longimicrobiales bacterium]|nr:glycine oxidase ThiO [Longimicrobiales bacterium]
MSHPDVVVAGGGAIGCAAARAMALAGADVEVIERGVPGRGATAAAAGMLAPWSEASGRGPFLDMARRSLAAYPDFAAALLEESGRDIGLDLGGKLDVAFAPDEAEDIRAAAENGEGALSWVEADELMRLEPDLAAGAVGAVWSPGEGSVDGRRLGEALWIAAARAGVRFRLGSAAAEVAPALGGGVIVRLADGASVTAGTLLVAAGAWSSGIAGLSAPPVRPVRGQMAALRTGDGPRHVVYSRHGYALRRTATLALVGATEEEAGYDDRTTAAGVARVLTDWGRLFPSCADAPLAAAWSGLRPATPDGLPIIGPSPVWPDVWFATGHFRNGILLAPETARMCAAGLLEGAAPPEAFAADRFSRRRDGAADRTRDQAPDDAGNRAESAPTPRPE